VRPPRRLVVVVRVAPVEVLECTDVVEGGRLVGGFVIIGVACCCCCCLGVEVEDPPGCSDCGGTEEARVVGDAAGGGTGDEAAFDPMSAGLLLDCLLLLTFSGDFEGR
jgi:hypothetical protein